MAPHGGISARNLHPSLLARLLSDQGTQALNEALQASVSKRPGVRALNVMSIPANLVNGDTITIGDDTLEVDIINTDAGVNLHAVDGALDATSDPVQITLTAAPATALVAGELLRIENEILKVMRIISPTVVVAARARCSTAIATHAANTDVFVSDSVPTNIPVGLVTTLTPAVFGPAFAQEFNNAATGGGEVPASKVPTENANFTAYSISAGQEVVIIADEPGEDDTATTEDFANSTDNVWANATMVGGEDPGVLGHEVTERAVTSVESVDGKMLFAFPFTPRIATVSVRVTATGQPVFWNGNILIGTNETTAESLPAGVVQLINRGPASTAYITPFDTTHTVTVEAWE